MASISANRSSWSRATLSSSEWVGLTCSVNLRACASSSSRTAMSASSRPLSGISPSIEEMTPRVKLVPVGLLKTRSPCGRSIATSIFVVVVLPFVPVTTTMPRGSPDSAWARNPGSTRSTTSPGSADPPPRSREAARAALPAATATVVLSTPQTLTGEQPPDPLRALCSRRTRAPQPPIRRPASTTSVRHRHHHRHLGPPHDLSPLRARWSANPGANAPLICRLTNTSRYGAREPDGTAARPDAGGSRLSRRRGRRRGRASRPSRRRPRRSRRGTRPPAAGCAAGRWAAPRRRR